MRNQFAKDFFVTALSPGSLTMTAATLSSQAATFEIFAASAGTPRTYLVDFFASETFPATAATPAGNGATITYTVTITVTVI